jgi:FKBP-type peptidyl-prolyl cis-trans isomerase
MKLKPPGQKPEPADLLLVEFRATTIDGTEFDSSHKNGNTTTTLRASETLRGLSLALLMMREGAKWEVTIPSELGYASSQKEPCSPSSSSAAFDERAQSRPSDVL